MNDDEQTERMPRSRLDLTGKLFRPHWNMFRGARRSPTGPETARARRDIDGGGEPARHRIDVICGGMYRACSTWQYEVVAHLIEQQYKGERLGYMTSDQYAAQLHTDQMDSTNAPRSGARWRVVKSHDRDRIFAIALADQRAIAIYAYRDVREVVFSLMHKRGMTFEQLLRHGMIHQILANDRFWMAQPDVLAQRYEDLLTAPAEGVAELARHLGIRLEASDAARIADEYSHESNRARTEALRRQLQDAGVDLDSAANAQICDSTTLLHWNHIRQGDAKSWHALASPRQRIVLERLCGRWLKARGYTPDPGNAAMAAITIRDRIRVEIDLSVACGTFLARATSQRFPRAVKAIKLMLGLPIDTPAGATAWADATTTRSTSTATREPHIAIGGKPARSEPDRAIAPKANETDSRSM